MTKILDGNALSQKIKAEIAEEVLKIKEKGGKIPHLAAILVGENPASEAYVRNKIKSCEQAGFTSTLVRKNDDITQEELLKIVAELNENLDIDGFIVQLPLPKHIHEDTITLAIEPEKDVDGFHPTNFGKMALSMDTYLPATPYGIMLMLERYGVETSGKHCVVVGRSNIVGTPISILLSRKGNPGDCTVTLTHSRTRDLKAETKRADIIIAAIGIPEFIKGDMVKKGAIVIDVGINRVEDSSKKSGYRLCGDVEFESVAKKASLITPVPGGVGPMTVTCLMLNTLKAASKK